MLVMPYCLISHCMQCFIGKATWSNLLVKSCLPQHSHLNFFHQLHVLFPLLFKISHSSYIAYNSVIA